MASMNELLKLKDYVTLTGTTLGVIALIIGVFGGKESVSLAFFLLVITLGTDLLDGWLARKMNSVNEIGIQLDSLSDSLTFGIAPGILIFIAFQRGELFDLILVVGCVCFVLGAILRLARFNISKTRGYVGVPVPITALMLICFFYGNFFYILAMNSENSSGSLAPFPLISYYLLPFLLILMSWLNITTRVKFGKKGKEIYILFLVGAPLAPVLGIIGLLRPGYIISLIISWFFFGSLIIQFGIIIRGLLKKKQEEPSERVKF
ncbi:MAG: CDP-alcohol phosphatidyltransferase family protein [Promethearchaeota archaeon]